MSEPHSSSTTNTNTTSSTTNNTTNNTLAIPSADILRLIQTHLTESNLHQTCRTLRLESGVGMAGLLPSTKSTLVNCAEEGVWGTVLEILDGLDVGRYRRGYLWDYYGENTTTNITTNDGNDDDHDHHGEHEHSSNGKSAIITPLEKTIALTHEMTILELADAGEIELAYASLRLCSEMLNHCLSVNGEQHDTHNHDEDDDLELLNDPTNNAVNERSLGMISSRSGDVERRITALSSLRSSNSTTSAQLMQLLPVNYYGPNNQTRHKRRQFIVKLLKRHVPQVPPQRLSSLLQQSVKWQCFTGVFPTVERLFRDTKEDAANSNNNNNGDDDDDKDNDDGKKKKKRKTKNNNQPEQKFDLVLGNIDILENDKRKKHRSSSKSASGGVNHAIVERMPSRPSQTIRLGKKSYIESALFLPDGKGLVTGSSDGFVEIWGEPLQSGGGDGDGGEGGGGNNTEAGEPSLDNNVQKLLPTNMDYEKLRTSDLPYQRNDDLMMHDSSILAMNVSHDGTLLGTASSDGTVCVWKIMDGKLLRKLERAHGGSDGGKGAAVTCIQFSPDGSKILTGGHDSTCREFGLLASRMLKEFRGHRSYVNCCGYVVLSNSSAVAMNRQGSGNFLSVVTASADGTVRIWDGRTAEPMREITPPIPTLTTSVVQDAADSVVGSKSIHTVVHLHSPPQTMIVIPRTDRAYLMSYSGVVLRVYTRDDVQGTDFLAATVSPSNQWLYVAADDGNCAVFDVNTGKVEKIIRSFAEDCSSGRSGSACEISGLVHHPHRGLVGGYSNDKAQKRGILTLWK